jgi:APA family basic amino acid/polyamine antiporter
MKLKREIGLFTLTMYGIGAIIGAGIYALIGVGAGIAGNMLWLAFLISALIAIFTGFSYAELSSMFPKEAAEYNYTKKAFKKEFFSFAIGWLLAIGTVIGAATVSLGFAGYFSSLFGGEIPVIAAAIILLMTVLNYIGLRNAAIFNNAASAFEILGLLIIIVIGIIYPPPVHVDLFQLPETGFGGIMAAISVIFFAYMGFENLANMSEEVKDSRKNVPKALLLSLIISCVLYVLVAVVAINQVGWEALSQSKAPLMLVVSDALGQYSVLLSLIALISTGNTVLVFLIASSRIIYGMSDSGSLQKTFSQIGKTGTPYISVLLVGLVAACAAFFFDIKTVAQLSDMSIFIAYLSVNVALIALISSKEKRIFISPRIFGIPVLAYIGALSSLFMLFFFDWKLWALELVILLIGAGMYCLNKRNI